MNSSLFRRHTHGGPRATPDLDRRLRHTLHTVAAHMPDRQAVAQRADDRARGRGRRRMVLALAALVIPLTAAGYVLGAEYVDQIPPKNALASGDANGERYWMIPGRVSDDCGQPISGVELVVEDWNAVGEEWSTIGIGYGDPIMQPIGGTPEAPLPGDRTSTQALSDQCGRDESAWLADPTRFEFGATKIDGQRIYLVGVHPSVMSIRVATPTGTETVATVPTPARPDGPRYAAFDVPDGSANVTVTLLDANGQPIPDGERDLAKAPSPRR